MRANLGDIYNETITVINRLDARDSALKQDSYFATVLHNCMWSVKQTRSVQDNGTVVIGTVHQVQIPEAKNYLPYRDWKNAENRVDSFTLTTGDYIIRGEITEEVTASNVKAVIRQYEPDAFQIQSFRDATKGKGFDSSKAGIMRFTEMYYVEG